MEAQPAPLDPARAQLERLVAIDAIKTLKARYLRAMDTRDWPLLLGTLDAAVHFEHPTIGKFETAAATVDAIRKRLEALSITVHHCVMPEIEVTSGNEARGVWSLHSVIIRPELPTEVVNGYGRYVETYIRRSGVWTISSLRLEHIHKDTGRRP